MMMTLNIFLGMFGPWQLIFILLVAGLIIYFLTKKQKNDNSTAEDQNNANREAARPESAHGVSKFTGGILGAIGIGLLFYLITIFTLFIGLPWAVCIRERWYAKHTCIEGKQLAFDGNGFQLFGKYIIWMLLCIITLGIYLFWLNIAMKKWVVKHTHFAKT